MPFERVATLDSLWVGELAAVAVRGRKVVLVNVEGRVCAYEDRCAHQAVRLSEGRLEGHVLTCPAHEWQYDVRNGTGLNPACVQLERYAVDVRDGVVLVDVERIVTERRTPPSGRAG